jgi:hypothetical protein
MLPAKIAFHGVDFQLGQAKTGEPDALVANGGPLTCLMETTTASRFWPLPPGLTGMLLSRLAATPIL